MDKRGHKSSLRFFRLAHKRGVSTIVATVLIVLITVATVSILWISVLPLLDFEELTRIPAAINSKFNIVMDGGYTFYDDGQMRVNVQVESTGSESAEYVQVVLKLEDGKTISSVHNAPVINGKQRYIFDMEGYARPLSVTVAPVSIVRGKIHIGAAQDSKEFRSRYEEVAFYQGVPLLLPTVSYAGDLDASSGDDACELASGGCLETLIYNGDAEFGNRDGWSGFTGINTTDVYEGTYSFVVNGYSHTAIQADYREVSDEKHFISGWFKSGNPNNLSRLYFGFGCYNETYGFIGPEEVTYWVGSETTLVNASWNNATHFNVSDCSNWITSHSHEVVAFDVDDSGSYYDLPNPRLSGHYNILQLINHGSHCQVIMNWSNSSHYLNSRFHYPIGTKIRLHKYGGTYIYSAAVNDPVPTTWTRYKAVVHGECPAGNCGYDKWRRGTKYIRLMMLPNYRQRIPDNNILFIDYLEAGRGEGGS